MTFASSHARESDAGQVAGVMAALVPLPSALDGCAASRDFQHLLPAWTASAAPTAGYCSISHRHCSPAPIITQWRCNASGVIDGAHTRCVGSDDSVRLKLCVLHLAGPQSKCTAAAYRDTIHQHSYTPPDPDGDGALAPGTRTLELPGRRCSTVPCFRICTAHSWSYGTRRDRQTDTL